MMFRSVLILAAGVMMWSCDSGDIYPEEPNYENTRTLNISYTLSGIETIPDVDVEENKLKLMFILYCNDGTTQSKTINSGVDDVEQSVAITYAPYEVERLDLSIVGTSKSDVIYTFGSVSVPDAEEGESERAVQFNDVSNPIELVSFERLEAQLFEVSCSRCHGASGREPYLEGNNVYSAIVNKVSPHPLTDMYIIKPNDLELSSMYHILTEDEAELSYPHSSSGLTKVNDITLLKSWIEAGAPK